MAVVVPVVIAQSLAWQLATCVTLDLPIHPHCYKVPWHQITIIQPLQPRPSISAHTCRSVSCLPNSISAQHLLYPPS